MIISDFKATEGVGVGGYVFFGGVCVERIEPLYSLNGN